MNVEHIDCSTASFLHSFVICYCVVIWSEKKKRSHIKMLIDFTSCCAKKLTLLHFFPPLSFPFQCFSSPLERDGAF